MLYILFQNIALPDIDTRAGTVPGAFRTEPSDFRRAPEASSSALINTISFNGRSNRPRYAIFICKMVFRYVNKRGICIRKLFDPIQFCRWCASLFVRSCSVCYGSVEREAALCVCLWKLYFL